MPAAIRFLSCEPLLEGIDLSEYFGIPDEFGELSGPRCDPDGSDAIKWVIIGGESGSNARPFHLVWARSLIHQCRDVGIPVFMKQLGSKPRFKQATMVTNDSLREVFYEDYPSTGKGDDPHEWTEALRVREFPVSKEAIA